MPIYTFLNEDGEERDLFFAMRDAPGIGETIEVDGHKLTRALPSDFGISVSGDRHFVAWSQPSCNPDGSVPEGVVPAPKYDMDPTSPSYRSALFASKAEVESYVKKCDGRVTYGE